MAQYFVSMRADPDRFDPKDIHVKSGDQIIWKNEEAAGGDEHTATSNDGTTFDTDFVDPQNSSAPVTTARLEQLSPIIAKSILLI